MAPRCATSREWSGGAEEFDGYGLVGMATLELCTPTRSCGVFDGRRPCRGSPARAATTAAAGPGRNAIGTKGRRARWGDGAAGSNRDPQAAAGFDDQADARSARTHAVVFGN